MPVVEDIGHIILRVGDMDRAVRLYRDVLGFETPDGVNPVWTVLATKGGSLTLWTDAHPVPCALGEGGSPINLHVADFVDAVRVIEAAGYRVRQFDAHDGSLTDPWGNSVGIHDHRGD